MQSLTYFAYSLVSDALSEIGRISYDFASLPGTRSKLTTLTFFASCSNGGAVLSEVFPFSSIFPSQLKQDFRSGKDGDYLTRIFDAINKIRKNVFYGDPFFPQEHYHIDCLEDYSITVESGKLQSALDASTVFFSLLLLPPLNILVTKREQGSFSSLASLESLQRWQKGMVTITSLIGVIRDIDLSIQKNNIWLFIQEVNNKKGLYQGLSESEQKPSKYIWFVHFGGNELLGVVKHIFNGLSIMMGDSGNFRLLKWSMRFVSASISIYQSYEGLDKPRMYV